MISLAATKYWYVASAESRFDLNTVRPLSAIAFLFASGLMIAISQASHRKNGSLQRAQAELEDRVRERTAELDSANHNLRELSARLMQLQDEERRRIARELHDSVGQLLVGLMMNLSSVRTAIERINQEAARLTDSEALVQEMNHPRSLVRSLSCEKAMGPYTSRSGSVRMAVPPQGTVTRDRPSIVATHAISPRGVHAGNAMRCANR